MGIDKDTFQRASGATYSWNYDVTELGYKYYLNDIHAAIGLAQLRQLDVDNARRAAIAARYRQRLTGVPGVRLLRQNDDRAGSHHLFCVLAEKRDAHIRALPLSGIEEADCVLFKLSICIVVIPSRLFVSCYGRRRPALVRATSRIALYRAGRIAARAID